MAAEDEYLLMSGLQHFVFCRRQWALIHLEQQWSENLRTAEGRLEHARCHDTAQTERRGSLLITRGMRVVSHRLRMTGACDVVEFRADPEGIPLQNTEGRWQPTPVEYKHGREKETDADRVQLCAQAMCLEAMLCCDIPEGAVYYGEIRRRQKVAFTQELRCQVRTLLAEMHELYRRGYTPKVKPTKSCNACSLKELCLPKLMKSRSVSDYLRAAMEEMP